MRHAPAGDWCPIGEATALSARAESDRRAEGAIPIRRRLAPGTRPAWTRVVVCRPMVGSVARPDSSWIAASRPPGGS
ncbi:MAG TPA: hypothetical protein VM759_08735, partial [Longimicrobium sp.]|nr:hypothetical protein [Longimicrobium sp.]